MNPSNPSTSTRRFLIALFALTSVVYCNSLLNGFTIDDGFVYSDNDFVRHLSNLPHLFDENYFRFSNEASYRPVCTLTYFLDAVVWSDWPGGPHLTNLLMYIGDVWLIFFFCRRITRSAWSAAFGAALFAVHPIHTEVINNISFREDLLVGLLVPGAWILYKQGQKGGRWFWTAMAWFCYVLALFSKENAVVFPFLFLLLEFTETEGNLHSLAEPNRLRFLAGLLICTAIFFYVRFYALQSAGELGLPRLGGSIPHTLVATTKIFAFYLLLFFCPFQMRALYPTSMYSTEMDAAFFVSFAALFILVAFLIYFRREKIFVFGMLWWFVALLPVSNLHPLFNPMAERYLFLPSIGLCLWVGWLIGTAYEKGRRGFLLGATGVLALFLSTLTFLRNPDWRDNLKLWGVAADRDPENPRILANLAAAHYQAGNYVKAIVSARRALKELKVSHETVNPGSLYLCIGSAFFMRGDLAEALESMKRAEPYLPVRFDSDFSLYRTLGLIYDAKGQLRNALAEYRNAADINPFRAELWRKIAFCELRLGRREQAMEDWEKARVLDRTVPRFDEIETLYKTSHYRPAE